MHNNECDSALCTLYAYNDVLAHNPVRGRRDDDLHNLTQPVADSAGGRTPTSFTAPFGPGHTELCPHAL